MAVKGSGKEQLGKLGNWKEMRSGRPMGTKRAWEGEEDEMGLRRELVGRGRWRGGVEGGF